MAEPAVIPVTEIVLPESVTSLVATTVVPFLTLIFAAVLVAKGLIVNFANLVIRASFAYAVGRLRLFVASQVALESTRKRSLSFKLV